MSRASGEAQARLKPEGTTLVPVEGTLGESGEAWRIPGRDAAGHGAEVVSFLPRHKVLQEFGFFTTSRVGPGGALGLAGRWALRLDLSLINSATSGSPDVIVPARRESLAIAPDPRDSHSPSILP